MLPKSDSMVVNTGGYRHNTIGDITDKIITSPFCIEALLAANTLPDVPEDDFDINAVTGSELSFSMMNNHLTNLPSPIGEQGDGIELSEQQKKEEEEDARLAAQYMIERERRPKRTLTKLKANDIERGLHADTVKTPPRVTANGRLDTPNNLRNWSRDITSIPRSPGTWNLNLYNTGARDYKSKETYSENTSNYHESNDVFGHLGEKRDAIRMQRQHAKGEALAMIFIHGMRYNPTDLNKDQGFRTVMIPCPPEMKLEDVIRAKCQKVGQIYHSHMCQTSTISGSTGSRTAKIIFVNQPEWIDDEDALAKLSLIDDKPAYKLISKTWPMSDKMIKNIADGASRTIILLDCPNFGSLTGQQLQDELVDAQGRRSPCHYALGHQILILDSDGIDKVCIVMNSINNAINFMKWLQSERRASGVAELKWHFGLDISMTTSEVAHHEEMTTMRREMQARIEERGDVNQQDLPAAEAADASPSSNSSPSSIQADNGRTPVDAPTIDKTTIARDASSSSLYSGPLAYKPCTGFQLNPTATNFSPAQKQFAYAPFPSVSGSFYADDPTEAQRGELYKKANRQANKEDQGPGFVYTNGPVRPPTPAPVEVPKMGLYQPKSGRNWADEEDDEDFFNAEKLEFKDGLVAPNNTPVKVQVPTIQVQAVQENGTTIDESRPEHQGAMSHSTATSSASIVDGSNSPQEATPATQVGLDRDPAFNYSFFGAQAYRHTAEPQFSGGKNQFSHRFSYQSVAHGTAGYDGFAYERYTASVGDGPQGGTSYSTANPFAFGAPAYHHNALPSRPFPRSGGRSSTQVGHRFSTQSVVQGTARDDDFVYEPYQPVRGESVQDGGEGAVNGEDGEVEKRVKGERKAGGFYDPDPRFRK